MLATARAVALVAHALIDGMSWPAAFVLGAIVSPTDPVAATAIAGRLGVPRRVVTIVEGEALINDATALVAYKVAVAAVLTGTFSAWEAGAQFLYSGIGGAVLGLAIGWVIAQVRERLDDPPVEITIALVSGYAAYLPAEELGLSGVTAAVAIGLYMGSQTSRLTNSTVRMQGDAVWQILVFLLNSFLFVFIGLQLPTILDDLRGEDLDTAELILYGGAVTVTVIVIRLVWTFVFAYLPHWLFHSLRERNPVPQPRNVAIIAWMGMRGAVSLAAALALPLATDAGARFDERPLILFIVFCVILGTLVLQGLSLPVADPAAQRRERRRRHHRAGGARPPARRRGGARADRRAGARGLDARGLDRPPARDLPLPPQALRRPLRRRRRPRADRGAQQRLGPDDVRGHRRAARRGSRRCATQARSPTRSSATSSATSTSRSGASARSGPRARAGGGRRSPAAGRAGRSASASRSPWRRRCRSGCPPPPCRRDRGSSRA